MAEWDLSSADVQRDVMTSRQLQQQQQSEPNLCDVVVIPLLAKQSYYLCAFSVSADFFHMLVF
jgi:hypothetical protein